MKSILCFFCAVTYHAQEMPSPNSAGLIKLQNVPVNHFNGVASMGVPLYTVDGQVPIALQYNTGGLKVSEVASC